MAALGLFRSMRLLPTTCAPVVMAFSTSAAAGSECAGSGRDVAVAAAPDGAATTQSKEEAPGMEYCYVLGESGKIRFDRRLFIPLKEAIRSPETFEEVPGYRFIEGIDTKQPTFTSQYGKEWIRTGYLAPYYAKKLGWTIKDAFTDGNVGMVAGLRVIAFLNLDATPSSSISTKPEQYPMSYAGFSNFLFDNLKEVYAVSESMLPLGLQELKRMTTQPPSASSLPDYMVIYNPEFLPLEGLAALYIQGWRLLRRQMIVQDEIYESYTMILQLDALMEPQYVKVCHTDTMVMCWIGVHRPKTIIASALGLIAPPGSKMNINALTQSERVQLKALVKKLYGAGGIQAAQSGPSHNVITPAGAVIQVPKNPKEATVLDVHRRCIAHVIEKESVNAMKALKPEHQASFANKRAEWKDGVQLLMHRFPLFPHHLVTVFEQSQMWDRLSMEERLPIPRVFYMPALDDY